MIRQPKIITTMQNYSWANLLADGVAGLTVAMVALPLSIAIAIASGASPEKGLLTAIIGGFFISLLGGSRVQIGGPTGAFIVIVYAVIAEHGYDGLILSTFMAGILLVIGGYFRVGRFISFIPEAVINGFTIGIAVIIATSQFKDFFGFNIGQSHAEFLSTLSDLWAARGSLNSYALGLGVLTIASVVFLRRMDQRIPSLVLAVLLGSWAVVFFDLPVATVATRFDSFSFQLPSLELPQITWERLKELFPSALIIAFLAGVESLLSALVADRMIESRHRSSAELLAQGFANIASSLCGGLPATGAIARTATNIKAGGKTPVSGLIHALVILIVVLFMAPLIGYIAMPVLAAILLVTAWNMSEPHKIKELFAKDWSEKALLLSTLLFTVFVDLTVAIAVGVTLGLLLRLSKRRSVKSDWTPPDR